MPASKSKASYQASFKVLEEISERLQSNELVDVDELIPLMDQATQAYNVCKERLEAVEKALESRIDAIDPEQTKT